MFILFYTKVQGTSYAPPRDLEKPVANGSAKGYDTKATKPAAEPASRPEVVTIFGILGNLLILLHLLYLYLVV